MGTTAQKIQAIANSKAAIKAAIEAKGVSNVGNVLSTYASKIASIPAGASGDPRYEVTAQGALNKKTFAINWFNDLTSIGNNALQNAYYGSNVTSASFPNLTSIGWNGMDNAFRGCISLTSVDLSKVTRLGPYGLTSAFRDCTLLTSVDLSSVTTIESNGLSTAFYGCTSLTSVDLSSVTISESNGMTNAFTNCTSLTTVLLKKLYSASAAFSQAFQGCTHLELVDFSETTAVPALNNKNAFSNTNNYYEIRVPNALYDTWIAATNWSDPSIAPHIQKAVKALSFKAASANSTISLDAVGTPPSLDIEYSADGGATFSTYTVGTTITLSSIGDEVMFRAGTTGQTALADDSSNYHKFVMTGSIALEDDVSYLLNKNTIPASTALADYAFYGLFNGCASLQNAPELPWTTMGEGCYGHMFDGCTALTTAPTLPSTSLDDYCYEGMFKGCTSITDAPSLPANTLATGCYNEMFYGCSSLNGISIGYTGNFSTTYFNDWVYGVAASGTILYFGGDTTEGTSAIPSGWSVVDWMYDGFAFKAEQAGSTVRLVKNSGAPDVSLQYTTDSIHWQNYTVGNTITLANTGNKVGFRATTTNTAFGGNSNTAFNGWQGTGQLSVSGNINSLLNKDNYNTLLDISSRQRVFNWMFSNMTSLVSAEDLTFPCTTIGSYAYNNMFDGCTNLTKAPKDIWAINVTSNNWPMAGMFKGTAITKSPYLHFTNVNSTNGLQDMFKNCSNLNEIKLDYTGSFGTGTWTDWVNGVAASGTFYYNGSYTTTGTNAIPAGWTITTFVRPIVYKNYINTNAAEMNTSHVPTTSTRVTGRFKGNALGNYFVGSSDTKWRFFNAGSGADFYLDINGMSNRISVSGKFDITKWYDIDVGNFYFSCVPVDGGTTVANSSTAKTFTHTNPLKIGSSTYTSGGNYERFDCAGFKIYEGETLVKDYRPALDSSNVACFYEEVSGTYCYPSSGTFLAY